MTSIQSYVTSGACTSTQGIKCEIVLPAGSTSLLRPSLYGELSINSLVAGAASVVPCPVAIAFSGASASSRGTIRGDQTAYRFLNISGNHYLGSTVRVEISDVNISHFGRGLDVMNGGAVILSQVGSVLVQRSAFTGNSAMNGGALFIHQVVTSGVTISSSNFTWNNAVYPTGHIWDHGHYYDPADFETGDGGAVYISRCTNVLVSKSLFVDNIAGDSGGGMYIFRSTNVATKDCLFRYNSASNGWGGGAIMYYYSTNVLLANSTLANSLLPGAVQYGGGAVGSYFCNVFTIDTCLFENNHILHQGGSGAAAVFSQTPGISIVHTVFRGNKALQNGGAMTFYAGCNNVFISKCLFQRNGLSTIRAGPADVAQGGALMFEILTGVMVVDSIFDHNEAIVGGAICALYGVHDMAFVNCSFVGNGAHTNLTNNEYITDVSGGAMYLDEVSGLTITGCTFTNNYATRNGGVGFFAGCSDFVFSGINATGNSAGISGGVFHFAAETPRISITQSSFTKNRAADKGGVLYFGSLVSLVSVMGSTFEGNSATSDGGALYFDNEATLISIGGYQVGHAHHRPSLHPSIYTFAHPFAHPFTHPS